MGSGKSDGCVDDSGLIVMNGFCSCSSDGVHRACMRWGKLISIVNNFAAKPNSNKSSQLDAISLIPPPAS